MARAPGWADSAVPGVLGLHPTSMPDGLGVTPQRSGEPRPGGQSGGWAKSGRFIGWADVSTKRCPFARIRKETESFQGEGLVNAAEVTTWRHLFSSVKHLSFTN